MSGKVVAVTGAAGFVAGRCTRCYSLNSGELIHQLLDRGYTVRGTVRSKERATTLQEAFPQLILYEADLLKEGSFDECFRGVEYVFHTASPFLNAFEDPQRDLVDPALIGTKNV
jgi:nucleoside-diphosphate-sugar epimerase